MFIAAIVLVAMAAMASAYSSYSAGQESKKAADYNAQMAEYSADQARQVATAKSEQLQKEQGFRLATMRQQYAMAGVEPTEGTPLLSLMYSAGEAAKDVVRVKAGGESTAWGFMSEAELQRSTGASAYQGGMIGAGASLLGGAARATSIYARGTAKMPAGTEIQE
jgi:hypothetical protein